MVEGRFRTLNVSNQSKLNNIVVSISPESDLVDSFQKQSNERLVPALFDMVVKLATSVKSF